MACALVAAELATSSAAAADPGKPGVCHQVALPVALASGQRQDQQITGTLCEPNVWASGPHTLDILIHGYTYDSRYWDWPQDPRLYSFADKDLAAGRATFAYDRLGDGGSSHPLSVEITPQSDAYQLHQVIGWSRKTYASVDLIGHSYGSYVSALETGEYNDADRLVLTGLLHGEGSSFLLLQPSMYPALLDPRFSGRSLDPNYVTTRPDTRGTLFYHHADPSVIDFDEAHKDLGADAQLALAALQHFISPPPLNETLDITRPVLLIDGQEDAVFCGITLNCRNEQAVLAHESAFYPHSPSLSMRTIADTGHDLALHPTADQSFAEINDWVDTQ